MFLAGLVPQTKNLTLRHRRHQPAEPSSGDRRGRMRAVRPHERRPLHARRRLRRARLRLRAVQRRRRRQRGSACSSKSIDMILRIWAQDPPYDIKGEFWTIQIKKAIVPELGFGTMPKPLQKPHPPIHISIASPDSASARLAGSRGWGIISGPDRAAYSIASHWQAYGEAAPRPARRRAARTGGCRATSSWRRPTPRPRSACSASAPRTAITSRYMRTAHRQGQAPLHDQAAARHDRRGMHAGGADGGMRDLWLAQHRARQARRVPRARRPVRHAAARSGWTGAARTKPGSARRCGCWRKR